MASNASGEPDDEDAPLSMRNSSPDKRRSNKVVLSDEAETISPLMLPHEKECEDGFTLDQPQPRRALHSSLSDKRLSGRSSLRSSISAEQPAPTRKDSMSDATHYDAREILAKVSGWINEERSKRHTRHSRSNSGNSDSLALEKLEEIMAKAMTLGQQDHASSRRLSKVLHPRSSFRKLRRQSTAYSSDTDCNDGEFHVPGCDATLDNSKTLAYTGGASCSQTNLIEESIARVATRDRERDREAWQTFKFEIVRLTHTLRLKGWRKVPMEHSSHIDVERLSGALTNAVYVVSPPQDTSFLKMPSSSEEKSRSIKPPPKLLLRIYGPNVEHLINREEELQILKRLARKRIGPRMLGTFSNGRFEEFFQAETLKPQDLRNPSTSKQIAMRMRELHEGIELLPEERDRGPFVWQNWNKYVDRCEPIVLQLDKLVSKAGSPVRAYVCGTPWPLFRKTVENYKTWLEKQYGGTEQLRERLVFAHNDTQYGNILRLQPPGESPLLLPANEHRQLIVIDFEYANANLPGQEMANHFTEWCYNYHDPETAWVCNTQHYPTIEEQQRFVRAYLSHRPSFSAYGSTPGANSTASSPVLRPMKSALHQSNNPYTQGRPQLNDSSASIASQPEDADAINQLLRETRLWRLANSAQWLTWGIVQAPLPWLGTASTPASAENNPQTNAAPQPMSDPLDADGERMREQLSDKRPDHLTAQGLEESVVVNKEETKDSTHDGDEKEPAEEAEEFDYLGYTRDRALFFWGDALQLGFVKEEDLPADLVKEAKIVRH